MDTFAGHDKLSEVLIYRYFPASKCSAFFLILWVLSSSATAQPKTAPEPGGYWLGYFGDNKINKHIGIHSEFQWRNVALPHTMQTVFGRVGLNVYLRPEIMATAGYGYFYNAPSSEAVTGAKVTEHRIWQQTLLRQRFRFLFLEHRFRLEQRFLHNHFTGMHTLDHRLRYRFQAIFPLYTVSPGLRHYFLAMNNEVMLNLKDEPSRIFDRNRFFTGLGYQVSPKMNFQLGYMNQFIHVPGNKVAQVDHILQFAVSYNMDDLMPSFFKTRQYSK